MKLLQHPSTLPIDQCWHGRDALSTTRRRPGTLPPTQPVSGELIRYSTKCYIDRRSGSRKTEFGLRTFKTKPFMRFARREGIPDAALCVAGRRARRGQIDADLGGGVIKQRIARPGQGRSGGFRTILLFRHGERLFFVYGFAKSGRDNLRRDELSAFRLLAEEMLGMDEAGIRSALANETISEVECDD